jgi:hypothetical protein
LFALHGLALHGLVLLCLSLAATSHMHAHDVCVLSL